MKLFIIGLLLTACTPDIPEEHRRNCGIIIDMGYSDWLRSWVLYVMTGPDTQIPVPVPEHVYNSVAIDQRWCW
jgi:hypothetical protein